MINKYALSKAVAFLFVLICHNSAMAASQPDMKSAAVGDATAGKSKSASCAACHGNDGNSPNPLFPKLAGLGEKYLFKQLQDIQSKKRDIAQMTGLLDGMTPQDLRDIAAYYNSQTMQISHNHVRWHQNKIDTEEMTLLITQTCLRIVHFNYLGNAHVHIASQPVIAHHACARVWVSIAQ